MSEVKKVFGIDLGTTYSCISYMDEHYKAVVIPNSEGERITPSVVFFEDTGEENPNVIVGSVAKESAKLFPSDVSTFIKRQMGTSFEFQRGNGEKYRPEVISSYILKKLVQDAQQALDEEIKDVVITVPAYFGINEKEATQRAGEIAGLNVVGLIPEPTAAAIAYGMTKDNNKKVLVYDLGGGTFDVTLITIAPEAIEVVVTGGDHNLGGKDWDDAIINYLVQQFKEQKDINEDEILEDEETAQILQIEAERAKKTLSSRKSAPISVIHGSDRLRVELSREKFEEITEHLLERTVMLTKLMIEEAKKKGEGKERIDEIILVGGSTRMPQVIERLTKEFNVAINVFDPDESVAKGAALYGMQRSIQITFDDIKKKEEANGADTETAVSNAIKELEKSIPLLGGGEIKTMVNKKIINVTSKSFGMVAFVNDVEKVVNLIMKNDQLPAKIPQIFGTRFDKQEAIDMKIMENEVSDGELELENAVLIGKATLELPAGLPAGSPIEVTFKLNEDGRLEVKGREVTDNRMVEVVIETKNVITQKEVEEAKEKSKAVSVS